MTSCGGGRIVFFLFILRVCLINFFRHIALEIYCIISRTVTSLHPGLQRT